MCQPCMRKPTDDDILTFLAEQDFEGDINATIARQVAADYLNVYPRSGAESSRLVAIFKGEDGKVLPLNKEQRRALADYIFPPPDSS